MKQPILFMGFPVAALAAACPAIRPVTSTIIVYADETSSSSSSLSTISAVSTTSTNTPEAVTTSSSTYVAPEVPTSRSSVSVTPEAPTTSSSAAIFVETTSPPTTLVAVHKSSSTSSSSTSTSVAPAATTSVTSSSSSSSSSTSSSDASSVSGEATFYGGNTSGGTCSFTTFTIPSGIYGTAYSGAVWDNAAECGACLQVTGPNGNSIKVLVVDECPECAEGHLDLFQDAFAELGEISAGIIDISYTPVACGITSPIVLHNKSGTSAYWFSMQVVNANEPIASLEISTDGGSTWQTTTRQTYNFFENSSGFGTSTVDVKVTSTNGKSITVSGVSVASDSQTTASANF